MMNSSAFRVIGILDDQSNSIYIPIQMAYQVIPEKTNEFCGYGVISISREYWQE